MRNKYGLLYNNFGYNTKWDRTEVLKNALKVQKTENIPQIWLDSRLISGKMPDFRRFLEQ